MDLSWNKFKNNEDYIEYLGDCIEQAMSSSIENLKLNLSGNDLEKGVKKLKEDYNKFKKIEIVSNE